MSQLAIILPRQLIQYLSKIIKMKKQLLLILYVCFCVITLQAQSSWSVQQSGTGAALYGVDFLDEDNGMAVGESGVILRTSNGGITWESMNSGVNLTLNSVSYMDADNIIVVGDEALILKSMDGGDSWFAQYVEGISGADLLSVDMSPSGKGIIGGLYMTLITTTDCFDSRLIIRKNYMGEFWTARILDDDNAFVFGKNAISQSIIYKVAHFDSLSTARFYYLYTGNAWAESITYDGYAFNNDSILTVGYMSDNLSGAGFSSFISRNQPWNTEYWYTTYSIDSTWYAGVDFVNNYGVVVGGRIESTKYNKYAICESSDQGRTWTEVPSPVTEFYLNDVKLLNTAGYIVGDSGLIMKTELPSVGYRSQTIDYRLNVYPNPASDYCMLSFVNPANANVTISLYSAEGKLVNTLFNGNLSSGSHEFRVPVQEYDGGLYYCTLMIGEQVTTQKISIIK